MKTAPSIISPILIFILLGGTQLRASNLDTIGVTLLRAVTTNLNGAGISVAQPEASLFLSSPVWEVNPTNNSVQQPVSLFTYASSLGETNNFPNLLGAESWHANEVAGNLYGVPSGVATNIARVDNFDAEHFVNYYIISNLATLNDFIVNQSFTFGALSVSDQQQKDSAYDDFASSYGTVFVSAVDNPVNGVIGNVHAPGTSYNCIGVG